MNCGKRVEIHQPHRRIDLRHLAVGAWMDDVVVTDEAEVAHQPHGFGQLVVVGDHGAALEGIEYLGGMEAEYLAAAEAADPAPR